MLPEHASWHAAPHCQQREKGSACSHCPLAVITSKARTCLDNAACLCRVALDSSTGELVRRDGLDFTSRKDRKARASRRSTAESGKKGN